MQTNQYDDRVWWRNAHTDTNLLKSPKEMCISFNSQHESKCRDTEWVIEKHVIEFIYRQKCTFPIESSATNGFWLPSKVQQRTPPTGTPDDFVD